MWPCPSPAVPLPRERGKCWMGTLLRLPGVGLAPFTALLPTGASPMHLSISSCSTAAPMSAVSLVPRPQSAPAWQVSQVRLVCPTLSPPRDTSCVGPWG